MCCVSMYYIKCNNQMNCNTINLYSNHMTINNETIILCTSINVKKKYLISVTLCIAVSEVFH